MSLSKKNLNKIYLKTFFIGILISAIFFIPFFVNAEIAKITLKDPIEEKDITPDGVYIDITIARGDTPKNENFMVSLSTVPVGNILPIPQKYINFTKEINKVGAKGLSYKFRFFIDYPLTLNKEYRIDAYTQEIDHGKDLIQFIDSNSVNFTRKDNAVVVNNTNGGSSGNSKYTLLEPIPGLENFDPDAKVDGSCALNEYANVIIRLIIGIAAVLAMMMIITGGLQYMGSEVISEKNAGRERVTNAIMGLVLLLASYAILNTINPNLLNLCPSLPSVSLDFEDISDEATTTSGGTSVKYDWQGKTYTANNACPGKTGEQEDTCIKISKQNLPQKGDQSLEKDTIIKVTSFKNSMDELNYTGWQITEGWPPSANHKSACHNNGTCLDLNTTEKDPQPIKIKQMLNLLIKKNMCPNYEVHPKGGPSVEELKKVGVDEKRIWISKGTGPHIHVVNALCK